MGLHCFIFQSRYSFFLLEYASKVYASSVVMRYTFGKMFMARLTDKCVKNHGLQQELETPSLWTPFDLALQCCIGQNSEVSLICSTYF